MSYILGLAFGIGMVAGLRTFTAPAAVAWGAKLGWLHLQSSPLAFMGSNWAVILFSILACAEFVADLLPATPNRIALGPLAARIVSGGFCGACLCASAGKSLVAGSGAGAIGAVAGAFVGYEIRRRLVRGLNIKDLFIALPEDAIALFLALFFVSR
jgi:uncharacterized membrane protein